MRALYLECSAGISGDMLVGALLDLGANQEALKKALGSIKAEGFSYKITRVKKAGIDCCDFAVLLDPEHENHDHDMAYLHGFTQGQGKLPAPEPARFLEQHHSHEAGGHGCEAGKGEEQENTQAASPCQAHRHDLCPGRHHHQEHCGGEHHHAHQHRGIKEITAILDAAQMSEKSRATAFKIFDILAEAEAKAHAVAKEDVHFHEVGAVDSIVDIAAIAVCLDSLSYDEVIVTGLSEGTGLIRCQHGVLPVPVPATLNIVQKYGIKLRPLGALGEFVTPTGAAAVAAVRTQDKLPEEFKILAVGLGAGKRQYAVASILRAMLIEN